MAWRFSALFSFGPLWLINHSFDCHPWFFVLLSQEKLACARLSLSNSVADIRGSEWQVLVQDGQQLP